MTKPTIPMDVDADNAGDLDPVAAFLKDIKGDLEESTPTPKKRKGEPPETTAEEEPDEHEEDAEAEEEAEGPEDPEEEDAEDPDTDDNEAEEEDDDSEPEKARTVTDEDEVEIVVDGEKRRASIKDLKRLYGQEAALTRKSQEAAQIRKAAETERDVYSVGLKRMAEAAEARWKEFEAVDYLTAKDAMSPQEFANLREAATKAYQEHKFFSEELGTFTQHAQQEAQKTRVEQARACVKALTSDVLEDGSPNPQRIEGWSDELYNDLRAFAVSEVGADQNVVDNLVDPVAIKILWMARQYAKGQKAAQNTKRAKPVIKAPRKALTSKKSPANPTTREAQRKSAQNRLRQTGSVDDAAAALFESFGEDGED